MYGYLMHHGVKGMRWGVRNYQNADGTLTAEGRARYGLNKSASEVYAKRGILSKKAAQNLDYSRAMARLNRDSLRSGYGALFKKGGLKTYLNTPKQMAKAREEIYKGLDEKYGKGSAKKIVTRSLLNKAAAGVAVAAISGIAIKAAYDKFGSSGKSTTNNVVKGLENFDISGIGLHYNRQGFKNTFGPSVRDISTPGNEFTKFNNGVPFKLMRPKYTRDGWVNK